MQMKMPEGYERALSHLKNWTAHERLYSPDVHKAFDLMKEMAKALDLYANGLVNQDPRLDIKGPAILMLRKFREWK